MKKRLQHILILAFAPMMLWAQPEFSMQLSSEKIKIGEQLTVNLSAKLPKDETWQWPEFQDTLGLFEVLNVGKIDTVKLKKDGIIQLKQEIHLTKWDSGWALILPVRLEGKTDTLQTKAALVRVDFVELDPNLDFYDVKPLYAPPFAWWPFAIATAIVLLLGALIFFLIKRANRKSAMPKVVAKPHLEPWKWALAELQKMDESQTWDGPSKAHYSSLSFITRKYLEDQFGIPALEVPTSELRVKLVPNISPESMRKEIIHLLEICDWVKFARVAQPPEFARDHLEKAREIVRETHPKTETEETLAQ